MIPKPRSIVGRLIRLIIVYVLAMGLVFMGIFYVQLFVLRNMMNTEEENHLAIIQDRLGTAMTDSTEKDLLSIITWATDCTDDEFWMLENDLKTLRRQVEDVFRHPERYEKIPVSPPLADNTGKKVLQILNYNRDEAIDPKTYDIMQRLANLSPMMAQMSGTDSRGTECCISTPDGVTLVMDSFSDLKIDETGNIKSYDPRTRAWYTGAVEEGDVFFSSVEKSYYTGRREMEYSIPVYVDNELVAVIEGSVEINGILSYLKERDIGGSGFSILVGSKGRLLATYRQDGELKAPEDEESDIRERVNPEIKYIINEALTGAYGVKPLTVDGEEYYAAYGPVSDRGRAQIMFVSVDEIMDPANQLLVEMIDSSVMITEKQNKVFAEAIIYSFLALAVIIVISTFVIGRESRKRTKPILRLAESMQEMGAVNMFFEMEDIYKTGDEIQELAETFESHTEKMRDHVDEIVDIVSEKERVRTELLLANRIQTDMLPGVFPAFPDRSEFDIYASMRPAKEVGGDFYDFFLIGEDYLTMVMADVSGKGVPAAMFMMMAKSMLRSQVAACGDPHKALEDVNNLIFENNKEEMFVTVWAGILDIKTGLITASNAAHEYPILKDPEGNFEVIDDPHGTMLGVRKNRKHTNYEIEMKPGSKLFLCTDGVTEATDGKDELFGMERLLAALNAAADSSPEMILHNVDREVRSFAGGAEQFDDLTMLCLEYTGV